MLSTGTLHMSKAVAVQAWAFVKCQSRSVMAGGGGGAAGTGAVDLSSRAMYTGRYINISILTYQKQKLASGTKASYSLVSFHSGVRDFLVLPATASYCDVARYCSAKHSCVIKYSTYQMY